MESIVLEWISHYGYVAIFGLLMLGIVGVPVPDEVLLVFAGFLVSRGELHLVPTLVVAVLGSACGITLSYGIGWLAGLRVVRSYGHWLHLSEPVLDRARQWFSHVGKWALTFGYFLPGVRHLVAIVAGSARLAPGVFATFAYSGSVLWCCSFVLLGYYTGQRWRGVLRSYHRQILLVVIVLAVTGGVFVLIRWLQHRRSAHDGAGPPTDD